MTRPATLLRTLVVAGTVMLAGCGNDPAPIAGGPSTTEATTSSSSSSSSSTSSTTTSSTPGSSDPATATTAPAGPSSSSVPISAVPLTPDGLGPLRLGMSEAAAAETGFIGNVGPGCEPSGARSAPLRPPLAAGDISGSVELTGNALTNVSVTGGAATEEGVVVGDGLGAVETAYASGIVEVDRSVEDVFGVWLVTVIRADGGTYGMVVDPGTQSVTDLAVPTVALCE